MSNWQVTYKNTKGKLVTKYYANINTATAAVSRLANKNVEANYSPADQ